MRKTLLLIAVILILTGCGARKTATQTTEIKTAATEQTETQKTEIREEEAQTVINTDKAETQKNDIENEIVIIEPVNPAGPMVITDRNGKKTSCVNCRIRREKTKDNTIVDKSEKTAQKSNFKASEAATIKTAIQKKQVGEIRASDRFTDRKKFNLYWLLIPAVILFIVLLIVRKYKNEIEKINPLN